jgi:glyceraldehyde 3-phosphate dehydrogenase
LRGILGVEDAELVSSDFRGNSFSSIVDSSLTMAKDKMVKITAWYDNEYTYACRLAEFADYIGKKL